MKKYVKFLIVIAVGVLGAAIYASAAPLSVPSPSPVQSVSGNSVVTSLNANTVQIVTTQDVDKTTYLASLQNQITSMQNEITALQAKIDSDNATIQSIQ